MKRIVSGITSTGNLTLGNYIGSIKNLIQAQEEYEVFMFVADLHGITVPIEPSLLRSNVRQQLATYLACGIDVNKTKLFKQSEISGHTEMFYYLINISNEGQLKRMTQYKDKLIKNNNGTEQVPLGILIYPILMAGDILMYNADFVIVGADQKQHLELTRDLVKRLNSKFKLDFKIPEPMISKEGSKVMALRTPTKKMSKSDVNKNETIYLLDDLEDVRKKIMSSLTDSDNLVKYDVENKPGVSNLITIYSALKNISISDGENQLKNLSYKDFKIKVADEVILLLKDIQKKYDLLNDDDIRRALDMNKEYIQSEANKSIKKISKGFGMN